MNWLCSSICWVDSEVIEYSLVPFKDLVRILGKVRGIWKILGKFHFDSIGKIILF